MAQKMTQRRLELLLTKIMPFVEAGLPDIVEMMDDDDAEELEIAVNILWFRLLGERRRKYSSKPMRK